MTSGAKYSDGENDNPAHVRRRRMSAVATCSYLTLLLVCAVGASFAFSSMEWSGKWDTPHYLRAARGFVTHDFTPMYQFRPGFVFSLAIPCTLIDNPILAGRVHAMVWTAILLAGMFALLRRYSGPHIAVVFTVLVGTSPFFVSQSRMIMPMVQTSALAAWGMYLLSQVRFLPNRPVGWQFFLAGLLLALSFTSHPAFITYFLPFLATMAGCLLFLPGQGTVMRRVSRCAILLAAVSVPFVFFQAFTAFLAHSSYYEMREDQIYIGQLLRKLLPLAKEAASHAQPDDFRARGDRTFFELCRLLFRNSPAVWLLLIVGMARLCWEFAKKRTTYWIIGVSSFVPILYWGFRIIRSRERDLHYSLAGTAFVAAAGFALLLKVLSPRRKGPFRVLRLSAALALCLLVGVEFVHNCVLLPTVVPNPHPLTQMSKRLEAEKARSVAVAGEAQQDAAEMLRWHFFAKDIDIGTPRRRVAESDTVIEYGNQDFLLLYPPVSDRIVDGLLQSGKYRIVLSGSAWPGTYRLLKRASLPAFPLNPPPKISRWTRKHEIPHSEWTHAATGKFAVGADRKTFLSAPNCMRMRFAAGNSPARAKSTVAIDLKPGRRYLIEAYVMPDTTARDPFRWNIQMGTLINGAFTKLEPQHPVVPGNWNRLSLRVDTPEVIKESALIVVLSPNGATPPSFDNRFDCITVREITPLQSAWQSISWPLLLAVFKALVSLYILAVCWISRPRPLSKDPENDIGAPATDQSDDSIRKSGSHRGGPILAPDDARP